MKDYDKNKEFWDVNNLHVWAMSQKLPINGFMSWIEKTSISN